MCELPRKIEEGRVEWSTFQIIVGAVSVKGGNRKRKSHGMIMFRSRKGDESVYKKNGI
jgi:hypothetical protein